MPYGFTTYRGSGASGVPFRCDAVIAVIAVIAVTLARRPHLGSLRLYYTVRHTRRSRDAD